MTWISLWQPAIHQSRRLLKTGVPVPQLEWSEALALNLPVMDDMHREFVDLLVVGPNHP